VTKRNKYIAPEHKAPRAGGIVAVGAIVLVLALFIFCVASIVSGTFSWVVSTFFALTAFSFVSIIVWVSRLNIYRQKEIDAFHRASYDKDKANWLRSIVIPQIRHSSSIDLTLQEASELTYTGKLTKKLSAPYREKLYIIEFDVDVKMHPLITLHMIVDDYYTEHSPLETTALIPMNTKRHKFGRNV